MARCDTYLGLNQWAEKLVSMPNVVKSNSSKHFVGMFGDQYPLFMYTLPNGKVYFEEVQADPWSSGPVFFIALKNEKGNWIPRSLWPRKEIDHC